MISPCNQKSKFYAFWRSNLNKRSLFFPKILSLVAEVDRARFYKGSTFLNEAIWMDKEKNRKKFGRRTTCRRRWSRTVDVRRCMRIGRCTTTDFGKSMTDCESTTTDCGKSIVDCGWRKMDDKILFFLYLYHLPLNCTF